MNGLNVVGFALGFIGMMLTFCYFKLCDIARDVRPKHQ